MLKGKNGSYDSGKIIIFNDINFCCCWFFTSFFKVEAPVLFSISVAVCYLGHLVGLGPVGVKVN